MKIQKGKTSVFMVEVTPKGILSGFVSINKPSQKFNSYTANIILSKEDGEALLKELEQLRLEQFKNFKQKAGDRVVPITCLKPMTVVDEATGIETLDEEGKYILKASAKGHNKEGVATPIGVFDAKGKPSKAAAAAGTEAKLKVLFKGYRLPVGSIGVTATLTAVQIIKLVEFTGNTNNSFEGFGVEEDGYDSADETETTSQSATIVEETDEWEDEENLGY